MKTEKTRISKKKRKKNDSFFTEKSATTLIASNDDRQVKATANKSLVDFLSSIEMPSNNE
ncbi:MAG: hypothetical protein WCK02_06450 [Bacteroidota bacterium]